MRNLKQLQKLAKTPRVRDELDTVRNILPPANILPPKNVLAQRPASVLERLALTQHVPDTAPQNLGAIPTTIPVGVASKDILLGLNPNSVTEIPLLQSDRWDLIYVKEFVGPAVTLGNDNFALIINDTRLAGLAPGIEVRHSDIRKLAIRNNTGDFYTIRLQLSRSVTYRQPDSLYAQSDIGEIISLETVIAGTRRALCVSVENVVDIIGSVETRPSPTNLPAGAIIWRAFITGLGTAAVNVLYTTAIGESVFVTDLSLSDIAPATNTRAEFYFQATPPPGGCEWHMQLKTGAGSAMHNFPIPIQAIPGDNFLVDIFQAGVASPWWVEARGYITI